MARDLIVFGEDWGGLPSSTQHLVRQLSASRKVVWVNSIGLRRPTLGRRDIIRAWHKLSATRCPEIVEQGLRPNEFFDIVHPHTLPAPRSRTARKIATRMLRAQLLPVIQRAGLQSPVLWTSLPTAVDLAGQLNESTLVYYCGDDFSALAGVDHATVAARETELANKADLILAASERLTARFPANIPRLLPHGVDYSLFSTPTPRAADLPDNGRPTAGFYGSISDWLDLELLQAAIAQLPHWNFVFIGKPVIDISSLKQFPNVLLLGERPHEQLPSYVQHWSVSLLPFVDNRQIQSCNPLKLREYLAAGRPIVSTSFPALKPYQQFVRTVTDVASLVDALKQAALEPDNNAAQEAVSDHSWAARAAQVANWLEAL